MASAGGDSTPQKTPQNGGVVGAVEESVTCKLYTLSNRDGAWVEIGVGVASIDTKTDPTGPRLRIDSVGADVSTPTELLLDTALSFDDIYVVQRDSVLVWSDPELGKDMALSFLSTQTCAQIVSEIQGLQSAYRSARSNTTVLSEQRTEGSSADFSSPWAVCRENLPALVLAAHDNKHRFGVYIMNYQVSQPQPAAEGAKPPAFFDDIVSLWHDLRSQNPPDEVGMRHIGNLTMHLLSTPFNSEQAILGQLCMEQVIEDTIDIVHYALENSGSLTDVQLSKLLSREARTRHFHCDTQLQTQFLVRARYMYGLSYLKDLFPLMLEEGDTGGGSIIGNYVIRAKYTLATEIISANLKIFSEVQEALIEECKSSEANASTAQAKGDSNVPPQEEPDAIPGPEQGQPAKQASVEPLIPTPTAALPAAAVEAPSSERRLSAAEKQMVQQIAFLHEVTTMVRGYLSPLEPKEELLRLIVDAHGMTFLSFSFCYTLKKAGASQFIAGADLSGSPPQGAALALGGATPQSALRGSSMESPAATPGRLSASQRPMRQGQYDWLKEAQKCVDIVSHLSLFAPIYARNAMLLEAAAYRDRGGQSTTEAENTSFVESLINHPPILSQLLSAFTQTNDSILLQAIHDAVLSVSFGIAPQQNAMLYALHGPLEVEASLCSVLNYWATGKLPTSEGSQPRATSLSFHSSAATIPAPFVGSSADLSGTNSPVMGPPTSMSLKEASHGSHHSRPGSVGGAPAESPLQVICQKALKEVVSRMEGTNSSPVASAAEQQRTPQPGAAAHDNSFGRSSFASVGSVAGTTADVQAYHILRLLTALLSASLSDWPMAISRGSRNILPDAIAKTKIIQHTASVLVTSSSGMLSRRSGKLMTQAVAFLGSLISIGNTEVNSLVIESDALGPILLHLSRPHHRGNIFASALRNVFERYFKVAEEVTEATPGAGHTPPARGLLGGFGRGRRRDLRRAAPEQQAHKLRERKEYVKHYCSIARYLGAQHKELLSSESNTELQRIGKRVFRLIEHADSVQSSQQLPELRTPTQAPPALPPGRNTPPPLGAPGGLLETTLEDEYDALIASFNTIDDVSVLGAEPEDPIMARQHSFRLKKRTHDEIELEAELEAAERESEKENGGPQPLKDTENTPPAPPLPLPSPRVRGPEDEDAPFIKRQRSEE